MIILFINTNIFLENISFKERNLIIHWLNISNLMNKYFNGNFLEREREREREQEI